MGMDSPIFPMNKTLSIILATVASVAHADAVNKPNIILFFVDDMGWQDTSVPFHSKISSQNRFFHTPNMERLAAKGVKFTHAYGCPLSSPSRASLLTGCNTSEHHITSVGGPPPQAMGRRANNRQGTGNRTRQGGSQASGTLTEGNWNEMGLTVDKNYNQTFLCTTLPQVLKRGGYTTMMVGKGHFGRNDCACDPLNLGFDANIGGSAGASPASYLGTENFASANPRALTNVPHLEAYHGKDIFLTEALTLEAIKLMDKAVKADKPFFLYFSQFAVHTPYDKDKRFYDRYIKLGASDEDACYASLIEGMDKSLGDVMDYLDKAGIADKTIIIFMSDNGGAPPSNPRSHQGQVTVNSPLRGCKGSVLEGGIREPMIVFAPHLSKAGTTNSSPVIIEDFFPSIIELAHCKAQAKTVQPLHSKSFVAAIGGAHINENRPLIWHFPHPRGTQDIASSAIRLGNMKLIHYYLSGKTELYDLSQDIAEQHNLIGTSDKYDQIAKKLASILSNKLRDAKSPLPIITATGKACAYPDGRSN